MKYIGFYDYPIDPVGRNNVLSASNKMTYIAEALNEVGEEVQIVSQSLCGGNSPIFSKSIKKSISKRVEVYYFPSISRRNKFLRICATLFRLLWLLYFLIRYAKKNESLIVYHSVENYRIVQWAKAIKQFKLILEVEEVYQDVRTLSRYERKCEDAAFKSADAFIFSTEMLEERLNNKGKPSIVIYGTYKKEPKLSMRFDDGMIHVIYAGTFDPQKRGAQNAILATKYLPENYHVHILGFGTFQDVENIRNSIEKIQKESMAKITYEGLLSGNDFTSFLQKCHIGLSTQTPEGKYNDTSFPSKVLTYLVNDLSVVSVRIPVLERSKICNYLSFYSGENPCVLAEAIQACNLNVSNAAIVDLLDKEFKRELNYFLNKLK